MVQIFLFGIFLAACGEGQPFEDPSVKATRLSSERYAAQTMQYIETQIPTIIALNSTIEYIPAMGTQYAQLEQQNRSLQATMRAIGNTQSTAGSRPTQSVQSVPPLTALPPVQSEIFNSNYQNVAVSSGVKEADGCATDSRTMFMITGENDTIRIYLTARALNVERGMEFTSRWTSAGGTQYETSGWTADADYESTCIYFWITSADIAYSSGDWKAELMVDGVPAAQTNFKLCKTGDAC